ncbi:hypothetical protein CBS101457_000062 [Exobasidium rhododendri]|nr:hypothetical protein CBS101457_000062 [Exobasidium rhododendri]
MLSCYCYLGATSHPMFRSRTRKFIPVDSSSSSSDSLSLGGREDKPDPQHRFHHTRDFLTNFGRGSTSGRENNVHHSNVYEDHLARSKQWNIRLDQGQTSGTSNVAAGWADVLFQGGIHDGVAFEGFGQTAPSTSITRSTVHQGHASYRPIASNFPAPHEGDTHSVSASQTITQDLMRHFDQNAPLQQGDPSWEYTLVVDTRFPSEHEGEMVYHKLSKDQKLVILEHIHQTRPYKARYLRQHLEYYLTARLARELLSREERRIEAAVEELFPIDKPKKSPETPWMTGLTNTDRKEVIRKIAKATLQGADDLRDLFLSRHVTPQVAQHILHSDKDDELRGIAQRLGLIVPSDANDKPWKKGTSQIHRKAIRQRMMAFGVEKETTCYDWLGRRLIPTGYGLKMLRANDAQFEKIMEWFRGRGRVYPPFS